MFFNERKNTYTQVEEDARRLLHSLSGALREMGSDAERLVGEVAGKTQEQVAKARGVAAEKGREVDTLAKENVWVTAAVAATLGALVSHVLFRRRQ